MNSWLPFNLDFYPERPNVQAFNNSDLCLANSNVNLLQPVSHISPESDGHHSGLLSDQNLSCTAY